MNKTEEYIKMVYDFRDAVGLPIASGIDCDMDTHKAVTIEELVEAADGMTDSIVTLAGIALDAQPYEASLAINAIDNIVCAMETAGFIPTACMNIVQEANMSKLCKPDEVNPTIEKYKVLGVKCSKSEVSDGLYAVYCDENITGIDCKFYPAKKLLKCINWHEPDWCILNEWMTPELLELFD
jgi:hypothetical protein